MIERAGRVARPRFPDKGPRGPSVPVGRRPVVPTGLKSARQLVAAAPMRATPQKRGYTFQEGAKARPTQD